MDFDYDTLYRLRQSHPGWRLLRSEHAALVASFLHRVFVAPNRRVISQSDLAESLEDELFALRERDGDGAFPRPPLDYLNDWANSDRGWLRKFYRDDSDEPQFDLTPAAEKAIAWLASLTERSFVGTESRLRTLFGLLRQMNEGVEDDPKIRIADLERRRDEIEAEIARVREGDLPLLDDTALKDRFQQFMQIARDLLGDFREVEHNFRVLDRRVRERIAGWEGSRGALLEEVIDERDAIAGSDQGRSFNAFWDFLMSRDRQEELTRLLERVLASPAVQSMDPDVRTRRIHYDWLDAGEHTQATVRRLSQQLRRFLDDRAWLENRRIMDILHSIEAHALALRDTSAAKGGARVLEDTVMTVASPAAEIRLPTERPLYAPRLKPQIVDAVLEAGDEAVDAAALFSETVVDKARLAGHIRHALQDRSQITLRELCETQPIEQGLAELVTYLQLASDHGQFKTVVDEDTEEAVSWRIAAASGETTVKSARLPRVIFLQ